MIWIIDASVAVRWFIREEVHTNADIVLKIIVDQPQMFAVPELFSFEVYSVLQRLHPNALQVYTQGIIPLLQGGILRHPMTEKLARKADKFVKRGLTGYDACYAALAEDLKGLWLTFDAKAHRNIVKDHVSFLIAKKLPKDLEV